MKNYCAHACANHFPGRPETPPPAHKLQIDFPRPSLYSLRAVPSSEVYCRQVGMEKLLLWATFPRLLCLNGSWALRRFGGCVLACLGHRPFSRLREFGVKGVSVIACPPGRLGRRSAAINDRQRPVYFPRLNRLRVFSIGYSRPHRNRD